MDNNESLAMKLYRGNYDKALTDHIAQVEDCVVNKRIYEEDLEILNLDFTKPIPIICTADGIAYVYSSKSKKFTPVDYNLNRNKGDIENYDFEVWLFETSGKNTSNYDIYVDLGDDVSEFESKLEEFNHTVLSQYEDHTIDKFIMYYTLAVCKNCKDEKPKNNIKIPDIFNTRLNNIMDIYIKCIEDRDNCIYYVEKPSESVDKPSESVVSANRKILISEKVKAIFITGTGSVFAYSDHYGKFAYLHIAVITRKDCENLKLAVLDLCPVFECVNAENLNIKELLLNPDECESGLYLLNEALYRDTSMSTSISTVAACVCGYHFFE